METAPSESEERREERPRAEQGPKPRAPWESLRSPFPKEILECHQSSYLWRKKILLLSQDIRKLPGPRPSGSQPLHPVAAMYSLVFLCAQKVVSHYTTLQDALGFLPKELYPVLFKAAFMDKRTPSLQQLVQTWPFPVLSFQKLLRKCQHCERALIREKPNKLCIQAIILGVDEGHGPESMSLWSRTVTLAKACLDVSKQQSKCLKRSSKRRKGPYSSSVALPAPQPVSVDVWVDLFVNSTSYVVLKDALQINSGNALRLRCRDFRAEELSIASTVGLLEFLDPAGVRQVDLRFNNLGLSGLRVVLPHLTKFTNLASLKLPYSNIDVRRLTVGMEGSLQDLRSPLESLELAFCYLLPNDFAYLSQSLHTSALKKLDLSGNNLSDSLLQPLQGLLTEAASSLLHLDIMECRLMDSHLNLLLPALCRCTRLRYLGVFGNPISAKGVKNLLHKTVGLLDLRLVIYPYPVDCYGDDLPWPPTSSNLLNGSVDEEKFSRVSNELQQMLLSANRGDAIWTTNLCRHNSLDYFSL
ncbi:hypothetical protein E2320_011794 [Naja naja]|nr:hypothetical protein E2320_011794 [Naja naja]